MPLLFTIRHGLALVAVLAAAAAGFAQYPPSDYYGAPNAAFGTGVLSDLSRLPATEEQSLAGPMSLESLPPPSDSPGEWRTMGAAPPGYTYYYGAQARGYYINDQRIEFTGEEATFAVEGVLTGGIEQQYDAWLLGLGTELFLNQPYDRNIFQDTPERRSFAANFDIEPFQISQLRLRAERGNWSATVGRFETPFGRYYYPLYRNSFDDSPFIRSEAVLYRETGMLLEYRPAGWSLAGAVTNGGPEADTNSSKAFVGRAGIDLENFACGASVKRQDGIGSEDQKYFKQHLGCDAMFRTGNWIVSAEAIFDEYGLRRPGFPLDDIFWGRSLYYRDLNNGPWNPIEGFGYYVNLGYEGPSWSLMFNYGEFYPEALGIPQHDAISRRALIKASRHWTPNWETYGVLMRENDLPNSFAGRKRQGLYLILGCQVTL